jgi:hypothetical protein
MKTVLPSLLVISALAAVAHAQQPPNPLTIRDKWVGTIVTSPEYLKAKAKLGLYSMTAGGIPERYEAQFIVERVVEGERAGTMWYPELGCSIDVEFIHMNDKVFHFQQVRTKGGPTTRCAPGFIRVRFGAHRDEILWEFYEPSRTIPAARATLTRLSPLAPKQVFQQETPHER